jgi:peptidylprolyl isomerase
MVTWRGGLLLAMTATAAACWKPITGPSCTPTSFTQASVSGDTITTTTGLRFIEAAVGGGSTLPWCQPVSVDYDAYLIDSTKFDSSRDLGVPLHFVPGVGDLIDGFEQGVIGMRAGGKRRLIIPPALGYGSVPVRNGSGTIIVPANSTLVFDVELLVIGQ